MLSWKLFAYYIAMLFLLFLSLAMSFYYYNKSSTTTAAVSGLANLTQSTMTRLDTNLKTLDSTLIAISTTETFEADLINWNNTGTAPSALSHSMNTSLRQNEMYQNYIYRIAIANTNGDAITYGKNQLTKSEISDMVNSTEWNAYMAKSNEKFILPPHNDPWIKHDSPYEVVSVVRSIRKDQQPIGLLELQTPAEEVERICSNQWEGGEEVYFAVMDGKGDIFLSNFPEEKNQEWSAQVLHHAPWYPRNAIQTEDEFISIANSNYLDWKIALILPKDAVFAGLVPLQRLLISALSLLLIIAVIFFRILSVQQTRPLYQLINQIEAVNVDNLDSNMKKIPGSKEVAVLQDSFSAMQNRLKASLEREKALEVLQNKALYDALQSRIDPHFMYNTLGSIANICTSEGADEAAEACYNLSDLLRYSAHYSKKVVTLSQELEGLGHYLTLLKGRYRHRLEYAIEVDDSLVQLQVPKLTLQPLVENAIRYSLMEQEKVFIKVSISQNNNICCVRVTDNGAGFDPDRLKEINGNIEEFLSDSSKISWEENMDFGGMGLTGTLLRLYLYFGEGFHYEINSQPLKKVEVVLYIPIQKEDHSV